MNLSLLYLDIMRTWLYIFFFSFFHGHWCVLFSFFSLFFGSCFLGMPSFLSFFLDSPCLIWRILERERSLNMEFYFVDGWNGIADFQCRSSAGGVHMILIKQVWKDISLGSQSLKKLNATTRHICVRFVSWRSTYGFGRTNTRSCKAMEVFFLIKISQTHKQIKQGFFHQTISHWSTT